MPDVAAEAEAYLHGHDLGADIAERFAELVGMAVDAANLARRNGGDGVAGLAAFADMIRATADKIDRQLGR